MSAYSTLRVTRVSALSYVLSSLARIENSELEKLLDVLVERRLYNTRIIPDINDNDDAELGNP